jgi:sugar O-acyltransferase (sialic acid O-acetyltransferase NeuD family)
VVKTKRLVIIGCGEFGLIAHEYFQYDSDYDVVAFSAERPFIPGDTVNGLPVVAFDELVERYPPGEFYVHVAVTYTKLNRVRRRLYTLAKAAGYDFATYISSHAFVWRNARIGENVFIFENNVIQPFTEIGNNVVLWSGNHIGHRSVIRDHCYLSSHVVVSGYCVIGESCFVGVNATFADHVTVGEDCLISMGAVVGSDCEPGRIYAGNPAEARKLGALRYFKVKD